MKTFLATILAICMMAVVFACAAPAPTPADPESDPIDSSAAATEAPAADPAGDGAAEVTPQEDIVFDLDVETVQGETVNTAAFAKAYDLTLVNFWATWCPPCVGEMPYLQSLYEQYSQAEGGQKVGFAGIWLDTESPEDLQAILEQTGVSYPIWKFQPAMEELVAFEYIPTTVFLDSEGHFVGEPVTGGHDEKEWLSIVEERLALLAE